MIARTCLDSCPTDGGTLELLTHDTQFLLKNHEGILASSQSPGGLLHAARMISAPFKPVRQPRMLIVNIGLGEGLSQSLTILQKQRAHFYLAEPNASLINWQTTHLNSLHPELLDDPRITILPEDFPKTLRGHHAPFHGILFSLDHVFLPEWLFSPQGIDTLKNALHPGGLIAFWSATPRAPWLGMLKKKRWQTSHTSVKPSPQARRESHHLWLIRPPITPNTSP